MVSPASRVRWQSLTVFLILAGAVAVLLFTNESKVRAWMCRDVGAQGQANLPATDGAQGMATNTKGELDRLFQEIIEHPELDAPRWAYAKVLRTTDPERAEFIELELELAAMTAKERAKAFRKQSRRDKLLIKHANEWIEPIAEFIEGFQFHRGFVAEVELSARGFLEHHEALLARAPIQHLILTDAATAFDELMQSPALMQIRSIVLTRQSIGDAGVEQLVKSPYVRELRWLSLSYNKLTRRSSELLVKTDNLPFIKFISLSDNPFAPGLEYWLDQGVIIDSEPNEDMKDLEAEYGPVEWLHHYGGPPGRFDYSTEASVPM